MNALQLQTDIQKMVMETEDISLLKAIRSLLSQDDAEYVLSDIEKRLLEESAADYEKGNVISHEDVHKQTKQWLKEQ